MKSPSAKLMSPPASALNQNLTAFAEDKFKYVGAKSLNATLAGAGKLGSAILGYPGFKKYGFKVSCAFDANKKKIGKKIHGLTVHSDSRINSLEKRKIKLAIIATPSDVAQNVTDKLVKAGVNGILNFAPCTLTAPKKVKIINIDIAIDLATLPYYLSST